MLLGKLKKNTKKSETDVEEKEIEFWNQQARKSLRSIPPKWFLYYIGNSYLRAVKIGLKYLNRKKINLLKTDLWNEGIEHQRDILSYFQNNEKFNLYGIDISPVVISQAKLRLKNVQIKQGDIRNLPFESDFFDIVLDLSTLDHLSQNEVKNALKEYERVLKKNGILVLIFWHDSLFLKYVATPIRKLLKIKLNTYFSLKEIKNIIEGKFKILEEYSIGTLLSFPGIGFIFNALPSFIQKVFLNFFLRLEYSKISKLLLKNFSALYAIIGKKI